MTGKQQFCVKWNSYCSNLLSVFPRLLSSEHFVDLTLACEGKMIKCHKVVLSACSSYFEKLLIQNPCQHPIIFMKDLKHWQVQALVDFMYKGEVNIDQEHLNSLLLAAESLQIRGLSGQVSSLVNDIGKLPKEENPTREEKFFVNDAVPNDGDILDGPEDYNQYFHNLPIEKNFSMKIKEEKPQIQDHFLCSKLLTNSLKDKDDSDSNLMDDSGINQPGTSHEFLPEMLHISGYSFPNMRIRPYRQYTNDNLLAALMDVKQGGSVYRASKQHGIPRKTLRNWMKRWNITSAYAHPLKTAQALRAKLGTKIPSHTSTNTSKALT